MLTFAYPYLLALIVLPLVLRWAMPAYRRERRSVVAPFFDRLVTITGQSPAASGTPSRASHVQQALVWLVWASIVTAVARPQWLDEPITKTNPSRDLLLAVDLSGSMETQDFTDAAGKKVDRLTAVKQVLNDFLAKRKGDRVGLIFFGSAAFVQTTFTEDLDACRALLDEAQVRMAGPKTAFGDAIGLALTIFERESEVRDRVIIALTDGNDTGSQVPPARAADIAHTQKVTIHTVAVGDPRAAGEEKLDDEALKAVAAATGGRYSRADDRASLAKIYADLDALGTREVETLSYQPRRELYFWPLAAGLLLTLGYHVCVASREVLREHAPLPPGSSTAIAAFAVLSTVSVVGDFHFLRPMWLLAIVPAFVLFFLMRKHQDAARPWRGIIDEHLLGHLLTGANVHRRIGPESLLLAVSLMSAVALAGPSWRREPAPFASDEAALVIVVEVTPTMLAQDVQPSRLARAAQKIHDLNALRPGVRTALVVYAGSAHLAMPLTKDQHLVEQFAAELTPDMMPREGERTADAIALANEQLRKSGLAGSVLLITDGVPRGEWDKLSAMSNDAESGAAPVQILAMAADAGVPVPADSPPAPAFDEAAMKSASEALGAGWTQVSPDDRDVEWLANHVTRRIVSAKSDDGAQRWRDDGYWLTFVIAGLAIVWFRPGWFVEWE
jgi:Ca-activated chloride channel homolog